MLSQELEGEGSPRTADYWHGMMHRREPDLGYAAYWFRSPGQHPALELLRADLPRWITEHCLPEPVIEVIHHRLLTKSQWDPFAMIELYRTALRNPQSTENHAARVVQYLQMLNLLRFSHFQ